ncbi:MAG: hypothetical protein PVG22_17435 [Chromatiales bacterium]
MPDHQLIILQDHPNDPGAQALVAMTQQEIAIMKDYADYCGYQFYVLRAD